MMVTMLMGMAVQVNAKFSWDGHVKALMGMRFLVNQYVEMESELVKNFILVGAMMPTIARMMVA